MLHRLIDQLRQLDEQSPSYAKEYEDVLGRIARLRDAASIAPLVNLLADDAKYNELMLSTLMAIEQFDDADYVREILQVAPAFWARSPEWASTVLIRILNPDTTRTELLRQLPAQPAETKRVLRAIAKRLNSENPRNAAKTEPVLLATEDASASEG